MTDMNKYAIFAFRGEKPCVLHAVLNCADMRKRGLDALVVLEGGSVKLLEQMYNNQFPMSWEEIKPLIDCACLGCSKMFQVDGVANEAGIRLEGGMSQHVSMGEYIQNGYQIIYM